MEPETLTFPPQYLSSSSQKDEQKANITEQQQLSTYITCEQTRNTLLKKGIRYFFPIQHKTFLPIFQGWDLIGRDRTGSGKTIAYSLPVLQRLRVNYQFKQSSTVKFLIVVPTRQLCIQVTTQLESLKNSKQQYGVVSIYGGTPFGQNVRQLKGQADVIVATPGRLLDLLQKNCINLRYMQTVCLDEADEMLKMGFQKDVERIYEYVNHAVKGNTQNLLFSATVPLWVQRLALKYLKRDKKMIDLVKDQQIKTSKTVTHLAMCIRYKDIVPMMKDIVMAYCGKHGRCIIFCERKDQVKQIMHEGNLNIQAQELHSDIPQSQRQLTYHKFKKGELKCLISTNVAARGLDIPNVDLIIQLQPPKNVDDYIHRSGRTGRAGRKGVCLTVYLKSQEYLLKNIEKVAKIKFRETGPPQKDQLLGRVTYDLVQTLISADQSTLDYFQDVASQFVYEVGAQKAVAKCLAYILGVKTRLPTKSVIGNQEGMITYKIKYVGEKQQETLQPTKIIQFLQSQKQALGQFDRQQLASSIKSVTKNCLVFNLTQTKVKRMEGIIRKTDSIYDITRISTMSQLTKQQEPKDVLPQYSQEDYENAMYYNYEVYIEPLSPQPNVMQLQAIFYKKGIKFVNVSVKSKQSKSSFAFALCLTEEDLNQAVSLDGQILFQGKYLKLRRAKEKTQTKNPNYKNQYGHRSQKWSKNEYHGQDGFDKKKQFKAPKQGKERKQHKHKKQFRQGKNIDSGYNQE